MSLSQRVAASFRRASHDRNEARDPKSVRMLGDTDDSSFDSSRATLLQDISSPDSFRVVDSDQLRVQVAQPRPEDTQMLRRRESVFFALFPDGAPEAHKANPRMKATDWGDVNPLFVSKLLVSFPVGFRMRVLIRSHRYLLRP